MNGAPWIVVVFVAVLTAGCGCGLMSFREYASRTHAFPHILQIHCADGALFYYGAAHTNDPANAQITDITRAWDSFQPTFAFNEGGAPPVSDSLEESVGRGGEAALVRWLARRDGILVDTFEPTRAELVTALLHRFTSEQIAVALVLRGLLQDSRRAEPFRPAEVTAEVDRILAILVRTRGLNDIPRTAREFDRSATRLVPRGSDWRSPRETWFDPVPDPPPTWLNAFARAESHVRDEVIVQKLAQKVRRGERVFAVIGGTHVVMQESALRSRLASQSR